MKEDLEKAQSPETKNPKAKRDSFKDIDIRVLSVRLATVYGRFGVGIGKYR